MKKTELVTAVTKRLLYGGLFTVTVLLLAGFGKHADNRGLRGNFAIPQSDTQKPLIKKNFSKIDENILLQKDTLVKAPPFKTLNVIDLKKQVKNLEPLKRISVPLITPPAPNAGNAAYKSGSGVILSPLNTVHNLTRSLLTLYHVTYSPYVVSYIRGNIPFSALQFVSAPPGVSIMGKSFTFLYSAFKDMPTAQHTYLLTLGTTATADQTTIRIYNADFTNMEDFEGSDLVVNPETNELRLLFSYGNITRGADGSYPLYIMVIYKAKNNASVSALFNHIQLVQID